MHGCYTYRRLQLLGFGIGVKIAGCRAILP